MTSLDMQLALQLLPSAIWDTLYMVFAATFFATLIGLPLGVILMITGRKDLKRMPSLHQALAGIVNIGRSFPFAILMVTLIPFTRWIVGTSLGTTASIVPLSVAAAPFIARLIESSLQEVDRHLIETAAVMGSTIWQIIIKILLPEALPSLILNLTLTIITLIGYSAMSGLVGGGGLGQVAIQYGYQRFNGFIMLLTVILLILLVFIVQMLGASLAKNIQCKRGKLIHD